MIKNTGENSFFGSFVYDEIIPKDHPLRKLTELVNWEYFGKRLMKKYKGGGELGRSPYDLALMMKMLLLNQLKCILFEIIVILNMHETVKME